MRFRTQAILVKNTYMCFYYVFLLLTPNSKMASRDVLLITHYKNSDQDYKLFGGLRPKK